MFFLNENTLYSHPYVFGSDKDTLIITATKLKKLFK